MGRRVDTRSDLYNLGLILYRAATGVPALHAESPLAYLNAHVTQVPRAIDELAEGRALPPLLSATITRMLAKDPAARPTAAELLEVVKSLRVTGALATAPVAPVRAAPGRGVLVAAVVVVAGLLVLAGGVSWLVWGRGAPPPQAGLAAAPPPPAEKQPVLTASPPLREASAPVAPAPAAPEPTRAVVAAAPAAAVVAPAPAAPVAAPSVAPPILAAPPETVVAPAAATAAPVSAPTEAPPPEKHARRVPPAPAATRAPGPATTCDQVLSRLTGQLAELQRHPEARDRHCRDVKDLVGQAELRRCLVPARLGTEAMACF